jgi:hypothetical protein
MPVPVKRQSIRRSLRCRLEMAAAAAAADTADTAASTADTSKAPTLSEGGTASLALDTSGPPDAAVVTAGGNCPRFLSLGLSPFFHMDDSAFKHGSKVSCTLRFAFNHAGAFYPFQALAAAKAKYGGGSPRAGRYMDSAVTYEQVGVMCHSKPIYQCCTTRTHTHTTLAVQSSDLSSSWESTRTLHPPLPLVNSSPCGPHRCTLHMTCATMRAFPCLTLACSLVSTTTLGMPWHPSFETSSLRCSGFCRHAVQAAARAARAQSTVLQCLCLRQLAVVPSSPALLKHVGRKGIPLRLDWTPKHA